MQDVKDSVTPTTLSLIHIFHAHRGERPHDDLLVDLLHLSNPVGIGCAADSHDILAFEIGDCLLYTSQYTIFMITSANIQVLFEYMNHTILKNENRTFPRVLSSLVFIGNQPVGVAVKLPSAFALFGWFPSILREPLGASDTLSAVSYTHLFFMR